MNDCVSCRLHLLFHSQHRLCWLVFDRHVVFYVVKYVTWFLEFAHTLLLNYANAPCPFGDRGRWQWRCRETASRQDTRQELGPQFNFKANRTVTTAPGARGWRKRRRPVYRRWPTGHSCTRSRSDQHLQGRRPENRPKPTGQTVRATLAERPSPELAGNVPKTGRLSLYF